MSNKVQSAVLGFPRIGANRQLKKALEAYWKKEIDAETLQEQAKDLRARNWRLQADAGIDHIPSNDFSLYDHVLDTSVLLGAIPARYQFAKQISPLDAYFAMGRGRQSDTTDVVALEMTKWFDTNYHYLVPEFEKDQQFALSSAKIVDEFLEAKALKIHTRPVLLGPVSYLLLGKSKDSNDKPLALLASLIPVYVEILTRLKDAGADWVQIDEPCLVLDLDQDALVAYRSAYNGLAMVPEIHLLLTTYFGWLGSNLETIVALPVAGLHIDLARAPGQLDDVLTLWPKDRWLSIGVVDGRNIWKNDLDASLGLVEKVIAARGSQRLIVASSCSLLHSPVDLAAETKLDAELKSWLAFAAQKLGEIAILTQAANDGRATVQSAFDQNQRDLASRRRSEKRSKPAVQQRLRSVAAGEGTRPTPFAQRRLIQQKALQLPVLPTTTIGSFPQTADIRALRAHFKNGTISAHDYETSLRARTAELIRWQEKVGLDVLVHGEYERTDMVEYFGEQLSGFAFTQNGWVQSYGSRCVKPPIIFGDVERRSAMTVEWSAYAQSLTTRLVKGMLTGPVTILQWSFVRDDQPRSQTCAQIALALHDEVLDLEKAGIRIIQIDEPALREGLPLRASEWPAYLAWSTKAFRLSAASVQDATQIHTHMCYAEFSDIIDAIASLDADVISFETSRSDMELLDTFAQHAYTAEIGPGLYDIHSPRTPSVEEMTGLLRKALGVLNANQVWVNPDCGLKTRSWAEVEPALINMVEAARQVRADWLPERQFGRCP